MAEDRAPVEPGPRGVEVADMAALLRARRTENGLSIRQAAQEAQVSFSTLSRVEAGTQPDLTSFLRLCAWLRVPPSEFLPTVPSRRSTGLEEALAVLRADPRLNPAAVEAIGGTLTAMYRALAGPPEEENTVACHLRASGTLRPPAAQRLASILSDLHSSLEALDSGGRL